MAAVSDGALVPSAVAAAIGLPASGEPTASLLRWLEGRAALLVLDNCEHLVGAVADLVAGLLGADARGGLRILATSREPLGVPGEVAWPVPPLADDEALQLFVERARSARP